MAAYTSAPDMADQSAVLQLTLINCASIRKGVVCFDTFAWIGSTAPMSLAAGQAPGLKWSPVLMQKWEEMLKDGFMETGDVMEQRGPNTVVWIDRKKNIMKLSQVTTLLTSRSDQSVPCQCSSSAYLLPHSSAIAKLWHNQGIEQWE